MINTNNYEIESLKKDNSSGTGLFINELKRVYSMEKMHLTMLSKLTGAASNRKLAEIFDDHLDITEIQVKRIEEVFRLMDMSASIENCEPMEKLCREIEGAIENNKEPQVLDSAMLKIAQRIERMEIDFYKDLRRHSEIIRNKDINELLQATLEEEEYIHNEFQKIADSALVNV